MPVVASKDSSITAKPRRRRRQQVERRRPPVQIPPTLQSAVFRIAEQLIAQHGDVFVRDSQLKYRLAATLLSLLPPHPRPPGRPGRQDVTIAERLLKNLRRTHPRESDRRLWSKVYPIAIAGYDKLTEAEKRTEKQLLRNRLRWRRRDRKRYRLRKGERIQE
jgi:hypothetical protein